MTFLSGCLALGHVFAQTDGGNFAIPNIIPPAPQAASLGRYGDIPVALNTGVPSISIPFFTVSSGKLSVPVSINYHGSGIKVTDMASASGLGWSLSAGGDISRVVQGIADESNFGFGTTRMPFADDSSRRAKENCLANFMTDNMANGTSAWDSQPDLFFFSVGNKSGRFMLKNSVSNLQSPAFMTIPYFPINIAMTNNFQTFTITDDDGTRYFFNRLDSTTITTELGSNTVITPTAWHLVKILSAEGTDSIVFKYGTIAGFYYTTNPSEILQEIFMNTGSPNYFQEVTAYSSRVIQEEYLLSEIDFNDGRVTLDYGGPLASGQSDVLNAVHLYNQQNGQYSELKRFTLFHSAFAGTGVSRLDSVQESGYYGGNTVILPPYRMTYNAYNGIQCPPFQTFGQDFWGYFNGQTRNPDLNFVASSGRPNQWGLYYPVSVAWQREADSNYMRIGTLQTIQYPTGGTTTLDFEANQITWPHIAQDTVQQIYSLGTYISDFGAAVNDASSFSTTFTDYANYDLNFYLGGGGNYTWYNAMVYFSAYNICTPGTNCIANDMYLKLDDLTTSTNLAQFHWLNAPPAGGETDSVPVNLTVGHTYKLYFVNHPLLPNYNSSFEYRLNASIKATKDSIISITPVPDTSVVLGGGLRIRTVTSTDNHGASVIKRYKYPGAYFNSPIFSGDFNQMALSGIFDFDGWGQQPPLNHWGLTTINYCSNMSLPLGSVSNSAISYNEIEEYQSNANGNNNGKTVYDYKIARDTVTMAMPFFRISNEDARGLMTEERTYKYQGGSYSLLKDVSNTYTDLDSGMTNADTVVFYTTHAILSEATLSKVGQGVGTGAYGPQYGECGCENEFAWNTVFDINRYYYTTSRYVLKSSTESDYDPSGNKISSTSSYDYQNTVHDMPTHVRRANSRGQNEDTYTSYVLDFPAAPFCTNTCAGTMATQLLALKPIYLPAAAYDFDQASSYQLGYNGIGMYSAATTDSIVKYQTLYDTSQAQYQRAVDAIVATYNGCVTSYGNCVAMYYPGASAPQKAVIDLQQQNKITPKLQDSMYVDGAFMEILHTDFNTFSPGQTEPADVQSATLSNPVENRLQILGYDGHGHPNEAQKSGGVVQSYLYDYQHQYPIAQAANAAPSSIAYTSFEADGGGNWQIPDTTRNRSVTALTGTLCYNLTGANAVSRNGLSSGIVYIVSYWSLSGGNITVNGTVGTAKMTIGSWTYYEASVSGATSVTVSGPGTIDELRLFPKGSLMTTLTYAPLIGVTSQCDPSGKINYFNYDGLGRLRSIRDQYGNILKRYDYQYQTSNN
jgi:YD repeat-containing protein